MSKACDNYQLDLTAAEFGACKCGFKKHDHPNTTFAPRPSNASTFVTHQSSASSAPKANAVPSQHEKSPVVVAQTHGKACGEYKVDLSAPVFNTCKCGVAKNLHNSSALVPKTTARPSFTPKPAFVPTSSQPAKQSPPVSNQPTPTIKPQVVAKEEQATPKKSECTSFQIDVTAAKFGSCVCGLPKLAHSKEALNARPTMHKRGSVKGMQGQFEGMKIHSPSAPASKSLVVEKPVVVEQLPVVEQPPPLVVKQYAAVASPVASPVGRSDSLFRVIALYDYESEEADDLVFTEGTLIDILEEFGEDWLRGRDPQTGKTGLFPRNFVEMVGPEKVEKCITPPVPASVPYSPPAPAQVPYSPPVPAQVPYSPPAPASVPYSPPAPASVPYSPPAPAQVPYSPPAPAVYSPPPPVPPVTPLQYAKAVSDFPGEESDDLGFRTGDVIVITEQVDENWCKGYIRGIESIVGIFPVNFVEMISGNGIDESKPPAPPPAPHRGEPEAPPTQQGRGKLFLKWEMETD